MRRTTFAPARRRRSPLPAIALLILLLVVGLVIWAAMKDTEVPLRTIEEDVTNAALAK